VPLLPANKNLGKISYLNSQTNPWKKRKWKIIWLTMKKKITLWDTPQQIFLNFKLK
jgi:hypothetical protein